MYIHMEAAYDTSPDVLPRRGVGVYEPSLLKTLIQRACLSCPEVIQEFGGDIKNFSHKIT